jgi:hypothetical protein
MLLRFSRCRRGVGLGRRDATVQSVCQSPRSLLAAAMRRCLFDRGDSARRVAVGEIGARVLSGRIG